jgi:hypothetical protein
MMRAYALLAGIALALLILGPQLVLAQEEGTEPAPAEEKTDAAREVPAEDAVEPEAPEAEEEEVKLTPVSGEKVELRLKLGETISGVVKGARAEVFDGTRFLTVQNREIPGAGIRVYYAMGLNGFLFVPYNTVDKISFHGKLSSDEGLDLARRLREGRNKSELDRVKVIEELAAKKRAGALEEELAAALQGEKVASGDGADTELVDDKMLTEEERAKSAQIRALLERFPPSEWKPSRLDEIKKRRIILNIYPTAEERAFVENYELWYEGFEFWHRTQQAQGKDGGTGGDESAKSTKPDAAKSQVSDGSRKSTWRR